MNIATRNSRTPLAIAFLAIALFVAFLLSTAFITTTKASSENIDADKSLINIYDQGVEKVILTSAKTIGEAVEEAGFILYDSDLVEPSVDEEIIASEYQVNIYRSRPVLVVDGALRQKIVTAYQTPEQIVDSIGLKVYPEDIVSIDRIDDITEGLGEQLTIVRAKLIKLNLYGSLSNIRTQANNIDGMLQEKGISLEKDDKVSLPLDTKVSDNMSVKVWREGQHTIAVEEPVKFSVERIEDVNRDTDYRHVKTSGVDGLKTVTYQIVVQNGKEFSRKEIASIVTRQAVTQVEVVGVKGKYNTPSENESITWDYLRAKGFSKAQTAGIMGNLMQEHRFNTTDTPNGLGIAQWTGGRRANLIQRDPKGYETIYAQLDYLMYELNGGYSSVKNAILSTNSLTEAAQIFQDQFERCNPYYCNLSQRIIYAQNILASHE